MTESTPIPLKELLIEATFAPNRAIKPGVTRIDLGVIGDEARRLYENGIVDGNEHTLPSFVTSDRRLLLANQEIVGDSNSAITKVAIRRLANFTGPKQQRQDRFVASLIHNHPSDLPPSTEDLRRIFLSDHETFGATAVFVANSDTKTVIFRGPNTPQYSDQESQDKVVGWDKLIESVALKNWDPVMSIEEIEALDKAAQTIFLQQLALIADLRIFNCPLEENVASLNR
jgi:hypothetical protein